MTILPHTRLYSAVNVRSLNNTRAQSNSEKENSKMKQKIKRNVYEDILQPIGACVGM